MSGSRGSVAATSIAGALLLLASLPVRSASAQCSSDTTVRWTWSYPEEGAAVSPYAPLLWRFVGRPSAGAPTYDAGTLMDRPLAPLTPLTPWFELALSAVAPASPFPAGTSVQVSVMTEQGLTLQRNFTTSADAMAPPPRETLELAVKGHYVGTDVELPSERCEQILFAPGWMAEPCGGTAGTLSIGFDVELQAVTASGDRVAAQTEVRAFAVVPEGSDTFPGSRPRPWPPECGPPRVFTNVDVDQPERCFTVLAFVDALTLEGKVVRSSPYCLGDGAEWPPPEPPEVDAGVPVGGAAGSAPTSPMNMPGFFCGCVCPPGVQGVIACDHAAGSGGSTQMAAGHGASGVGNTGAGGRGGAASLSSGEVGGAGANASANTDEGGGCGCRLVRASSPRSVPLTFFFTLAAWWLRRRRARAPR